LGVFKTEKTRRSNAELSGKFSIGLFSPFLTEKSAQLQFQRLAHVETLKRILFFLWNK